MKRISLLIAFFSCYCFLVHAQDLPHERQQQQSTARSSKGVVGTTAAALNGDGHRDLKGSSSKSSSGGGIRCDRMNEGQGLKFCSGCQTVKFFVKIKDVEGQQSNTTIQYATVPLYMKSEKEPVGELQGYSIPFQSGSISQSVMTFNQNTAITFISAPGAKISPIIGGSGKIRCGSGSVSRTVKKTKVLFDTYVCSICG